MAWRKVSINIFGPRPTIAPSKGVGGPSKNIVEWIPPQLIIENIGYVATKENKLVSYWKKSKEVNHTKYSLFLKDMEGEALQLFLYASKNFDVASYELVGKVLDLYIRSNSKNLYILSKPPKSHDKIRYNFTLAMYNIGEDSSGTCIQIVNDSA